MKKSDANKIAKLLKGANRLLLTGHRDPDGDSIGSQLAFYEYWTRQRGGKADVINHGVLPRKYDCLNPMGVVKPPSVFKRRRKWDAVVVFECASLDRIGNVQSLLPADIPIVNIDHHQHNSEYGTINVVDSGAAACGEMIYDLLRFWKADITPLIAQQLAAAIITDTGRFQYRSTTARTLELTADLMRCGANLTELTDAIYYSFPQTHFRLVMHVMGNAQLRAGGKICFITLSEADRRRFGVPLRDLEGLVDYTLYLRGVKVGALLKEIGRNKTKVSLRSSDSCNVSEIARQFGGGGHPNASGLVMEMSLDEAVRALAKAIGPLQRARKTRRGC